jgi:hypothetical protein
MGSYGSLPADDDDLSTTYTAQNYTDVGAKDGTRVNISCGDGQYAIHQFRNYIGASASVIIRWEGQASQAPAVSAVYLQVYNTYSNEWDTVDTDSTTAADTDFVLAYNLDDTTRYVDGGVMTCRVYQLG